jgi:phosphoribosyl-AMP cyclohydrolase
VAAAATGEVAIEEAMVVLVLVVVVDTEEAMLGMVVLASQEADVGIKEVLVVAASREEHHAVARGKCSGNISLSVYRSKQQLIRKSSA